MIIHRIIVRILRLNNIVCLLFFFIQSVQLQIKSICLMLHRAINSKCKQTKMNSAPSYFHLEKTSFFPLSLSLFSSSSSS